MTYSTWILGVQAAFENVWAGFAAFIPGFLAAIVILIIGWIVSVIVGKAVAHLIRSVKIDSAFKNTEVEKVVERGGITLDIGHFIGSLVKWFILVVFFVAALNVLGLDRVNFFMEQVLAYIPQVIVSVFILLIAAVVGEFLQRVVAGSASAAGLPSANLLGSVTKWSIWIFALLAALFQLGIAATFVQTLFTGVIVALSLALGLSFGLGGQDAAAEYIAKLRKEITSRK